MVLDHVRRQWMEEITWDFRVDPSITIDDNDNDNVVNVDVNLDGNPENLDKATLTSKSNLCKISTLECWQFDHDIKGNADDDDGDDVVVAQENKNYRAMSMVLDSKTSFDSLGPTAAAAITNTDTSSVRNATVSNGIDGDEDRFRKWLYPQKPYLPPDPPSIGGGSGVVLQGGLRIIFCDGLHALRSIGISKSQYTAIEKALHLHAATVSALCAIPGTYGFFHETNTDDTGIESISVVAKVPQRTDLTNYILSLHHDVATGWTNALICGADAVHHRITAAGHRSSQHAQLTSLILASPRLWNNPLFLAFVLIHDYEARIDVKAGDMITQVRAQETLIGITEAAVTRKDFDRTIWSRRFDPKRMSIESHSHSTRLLNLGLAFQWSLDYATTLVQASQGLMDHASCRRHRKNLQRLNQEVEFVYATIKRRQARLAAFENRAKLQVNVLSNMISQQDSLINRQDALLNFRIAKSSKQDSISMTTFTFITAMFLPGTFVATLFSMSMFDWQLGEGGAATTTATSDAKTSNVSSKFWIFWAVTVPLTMMTMTTWYFWSKFSNKNWLEELQTASGRDLKIKSFPHSSEFEPSPDLNSRPSPSLRLDSGLDSGFDLYANERSESRGLGQRLQSPFSRPHRVRHRYTTTDEEKVSDRIETNASLA